MRLFHPHAPRHAAIAAACVCLPLTIFSGALRADIRVPDRRDPETEGVEVTLHVREDADRPGHALRIPRHLLESLAERAPAGGGSTATPGRTRSIVAGIALSAAVACGLVAFRRRAARGAAALVCLAVAGAVVVPALADIPVPGGGGRPRPRPLPPGAAPLPVDGRRGESIPIGDAIRVVVEVTDGDSLELVVGKR